MEIMFSWLKYRSNFISRSVRKQNMEWSNGVIFLIATFCPEGLCRAELECVSGSATGPHRRIDLPNDAVSAFADDILNVVLIRNIEGNLSRTSRRRWLRLNHYDDGLCL